MLEITEGTIINEQSIETGNTEYTRRGQIKQKHNTIYVGHHYRQTNTSNIKDMSHPTNNWRLLQYS